MGASNHPTTQPESVDEEARRVSLKRDLIQCDCIENVRRSMIAGLVVETTKRGLEPDALRVLADHGARVGTNKGHDDPWEVFFE